MNENDRSAFLNLFVESDRPAVSKFFFDLVRSCPRNMLSIEFVIKKATVLSGMSGNQYRVDKVHKLNRMVEGIKSNHEITAKYIDFLYYWESLSKEEKERFKKIRSSQAPEAQDRMAQYPPTNRQLNYIANLGYRGNLPANMAEASKLIDQLIKR